MSVSQTDRDFVLGATELGATRSDTDPPLAEPEATPDRGHVIGRFVVLEVLGTGGMGVVYAAYDPHLDRKVALKLLRTQVMESEEARARMLREAQAMARIDHPNVLRVHEAGTFGDQIYIAMEFAAGGTLRSWLAATRRTPREIVSMFVQAGRGLAAAHAAGLVHRDFKPDNALLLEDGRVRVTDFGLVGVVGELQAARPADLDAPITDSTPLSQDLTRTGALMGTPAYMAPEQFRGGLVGHGVDQFAFCVALYEALYARRPFEGVTFAELCANVITGEVVQPPRDSEVPARFGRAVLRGLATEPEQRYPNMTDLLADLAPDRARRRLWIAAAIAILAVAGAVGAVAFLPRATAACSGSEARLATAWNPVQKGRLSQVFDTSHRPYAHATFVRVTPNMDRWGDAWMHEYVGACEDTRVRQIQSEHLLDLRMECLNRDLDRARAMIDVLATGKDDAVDHALEEVDGLPSPAACGDAAALSAAVTPPSTSASKEAEAAVRKKLDEARAQLKLAHYKPSLALAERALADARVTGFAPSIAHALFLVGLIQTWLADPKALATLRDAMHAAIASGDDELAVDAAGTRIMGLAKDPKRFPTADEVAQVAIALADRANVSVEVRVGFDGELCSLRTEEGRLDDAQKVCDDALALANKQLAADSQTRINLLNQVGILAAARHRYDDQLRLFKEIVDVEEHKYGPDHPITANALDNVADAYIEAGKVVDSKQMHERALAIRIATFGPDHPDVAHSYDSLGQMYTAAGDDATAKGYYEKALAVYTKAFGDDSIQLTTTLTNLGNSLESMGDLAAARAVLERGLAILEKAYAPDDPRLTILLTNLGDVAKASRRYDDALALFQRVGQICTKAFGANDSEAADSVGNIADTYTLMHRFADAREATNRTLALMAKIHGPESPRMAFALTNDGVLRLKTHDAAGALASLQKALPILEATMGKEHPTVAAVLTVTAQALNALDRQAEAIPLVERALAIDAPLHLAPNDLGEIHFALADALVVRASTRARARAEAMTALADYQQAHEPIDVAKVKRWLATH